MQVWQSYPDIAATDVPANLRAGRGRLVQWFGGAVLRLGGWRVVGEIPELPRMLLCAAPHTSNWDFVWGMAAILKMDCQVRWLGKHTIFRPGTRRLLRWLGGIPVNRANPASLIDDVAALAAREGSIAFAMAPEGTRKKVDNWKSGFLRITEAADCQLVLAAFDFPSRCLVVGERFATSGDHDTDIAAIKARYAPFTAKYPEQF
jgi:1-acyl-sn-glycerol-3-phosphate acyltransferase